MKEVDIIRLNVERFRRLLQTDLDEWKRHAIQAMLAEFELELVRQTRPAGPRSFVSP